MSSSRMALKRFRTIETRFASVSLVAAPNTDVCKVTSARIRNPVRVLNEHANGVANDENEHVKVVASRI